MTPLETTTLVVTDMKHDARDLAISAAFFGFAVGLITGASLL